MDKSLSYKIFWVYCRMRRNMHEWVFMKSWKNNLRKPLVSHLGFHVMDLVINICLEHLSIYTFPLFVYKVFISAIFWPWFYDTSKIIWFVKDLPVISINILCSNSGKNKNKVTQVWFWTVFQQGVPSFRKTLQPDVDPLRIDCEPWDWVWSYEFHSPTMATERLHTHKSHNCIKIWKDSDIV